MDAYPMLRLLKNHSVSIVVVTVASFFYLLSLYFSYEDIHTFYLYQDPVEANELLQTPEFARHLGSYYFSYFLFILFGYNPFFYHLVIVFFIIVLNLIFYQFLVLLTKNRTLSVITALLYSPGYFGVESYSWNMTSGVETVIALTGFLLLLIPLIRFNETGNKKYFVISLLLYAVLIYFFKARVITAIATIFLLYVLIFKKLPLKTKLIQLFLFSGLAFLSFFSHVTSGASNFHGTIVPLTLMSSFAATLGNLFIPSRLIHILYDFVKRSYATEFSFDTFNSLIGTVILAGLLIFFINLIRRKSKNRVFFFISGSLLVFYIVMVFLATLLESGLPVTVMDSIHHVLTPVTIWSSLVMGIVCYTLYKKQKILGTILIVVLVGLNIYFSAEHLRTIATTKGTRLRNFYSFVQEKVPVVDKPSVFHFLYASPRPYYPFSAGNPRIKQNGYIAGYYGINQNQIFLIKEFRDVPLTIKNNTIDWEHFHYFFIGPDKILYLTPEFLNLTDSPEPIIVSINNLESQDINKESFAPFYLTFSLDTAIDLSVIPVHSELANLTAYYELFIQRQTERQSYVLETSPQESSDTISIQENMIDGNYATVWQPIGWEKDGVRIITDLGEEQEISHIVWSGSRISPRPIRSPSEYRVSISADRQNWKEIETKTITEALKANEVFISSFTPEKTRYVQIHITKTIGNYAPSIDEIEVFDDRITDFTYQTYYEVKSKPLAYVPTYEILEQLYNQVYKNNIQLAIYAQYDGETIWKEERKKSVLIPASSTSKQQILFLPEGLFLKKIKFEPLNFPVTFSVSDVQMRYLSRDEILNAIPN